MCGKAAVPTIKQNTNAKKLRRPASRAFSVAPGKASPWRSGGPARAAKPLSLVQAVFASASDFGYLLNASSAALVAAVSLAALASATALSSVLLPSAKAFAESFSLTSDP